MKPSITSLLPILLVVATGCQSAPSESATVKKDSDSSTAAPSSSPVATPESTSPQAASPAPSSAPVAATPASAPPSQTAASSHPTKSSANSSISGNLNHDGYAYAGVQNSKPIDMELTMSTQPNTVTTGAQTITQKQAAADKIVYSIDRSGGLAALGTEEWTVTKDGVYTTKSSMMDLGDKAMELPASPKPGMTWTAHTKSSQPGAAMDMQMTFKVIGLQDVKTKAGSFKQALLVEQDGTGTLQGKKVRTESQNWYVKGIGLVKATMKNHLPDGKTETLMIQDTKKP